MKFPSSVKKLLENKYVLYIVFFLAVANVLGYLAMGNYKAVVAFVLLGYLVYHFNKNMVVALGVPLIIISIFASSIMREGVVGSMDESEKKAADNKEDNKDDKQVEKPADSDVKVDNATGAAVVKNAEKDAKDASGNPIPKPTEQGFTTVYNKKNNRVDYAATVEDAYGDLNKILGGDGIKNLTADTQKLMNQQLQLAEAMKSMTPLLDQAKSLMNGFDMKNFGNIAEMAKQFKASA
jgi:hypothetical protein